MTQNGLKWILNTTLKNVTFCWQDPPPLPNAMQWQCNLCYNFWWLPFYKHLYLCLYIFFTHVWLEEMIMYSMFIHQNKYMMNRMSQIYEVIKLRDSSEHEQNCSTTFYASRNVIKREKASKVQTGFLNKSPHQVFSVLYEDTPIFLFILYVITTIVYLQIDNK